MSESRNTDLAVLSDEGQAGVNEPLEHVLDEVGVVLGEDGGQRVDPRVFHGSPAERRRLEVDHAAAAHRRRLQPPTADTTSSC